MNIGQRVLMQLSISYKLKAARFVLARNLTAYVNGSAMTNEKSADTSHALALSAEVERVISFFASTRALDRNCPFCDLPAGSLEQMQKHVAYHLETIALFALPRSTGLEKG